MQWNFQFNNSMHLSSNKCPSSLAFQSVSDFASPRPADLQYQDNTESRTRNEKLPTIHDLCIGISSTANAMMRRVLSIHALAGGRKPQIFHSDQGCQFTARESVARLRRSRSAGLAAGDQFDFQDSLRSIVMMLREMFTVLGRAKTPWLLSSGRSFRFGSGPSRQLVSSLERPICSVTRASK